MLCGLLHNQKTANLLYPAESLSHSLCCFPLLRRRGGRLPYCASWTEHQTKAGHGLPEKALNRKIKTDTKHPVQLSGVSPRHLLSHCGYFKCLVVVREVTGLCGEGDKAWKKSSERLYQVMCCSFLTLRLLTHLKEYLHFFDFHLPFPQLFLPGALAVFVGVSGRSAFVPLSMLTASSYNTRTYQRLVFHPKWLLKYWLHMLIIIPRRDTPIQDWPQTPNHGHYFIILNQYNIQSSDANIETNKTCQVSFLEHGLSTGRLPSSYGHSQVFQRNQALEIYCNRSAVGDGTVV